MKLLLQEMKLSVLVLFVYFVVPAGTATVEDVKRLLATANSTNYDKRIRPLKNQTNILGVKLDLLLYGVIEFDQTKQELSTVVDLGVHWKDEFLAWKKEDYGGIEDWPFPQDDIWTPDIRLLNPLTYSEGFGHGDLWITSDGNVSWFHREVLKSHCNADTRGFPFDRQICGLVFGCFPESQLKLLIGEDGFSVMSDQYNSEWKLSSMAITRIFSVNNNHTLEVALILHRKWKYYMVYYFAPMMIVTVLSPFSFLLPVESGERSGFAGTIFLTFGVFLTNVAALIPRYSEAEVGMSNYIVIMMFINGFIVAFSLFQRRFSMNNRSMNNWMKCVDMQCFIVILCAVLYSSFFYPFLLNERERKGAIVIPARSIHPVSYKAGKMIDDGLPLFPP